VYHSFAEVARVAENDGAGDLRIGSRTEFLKGGSVTMAGASAQPIFERDPVKLDPGHYRVELQNDRIRLVWISYGPRERSVMHQHPPGLAVFLTDANFEFTYPNGKKENIQAKAGQFLWFAEIWEHLPENLSDRKFEALYVELKT
jgi:hypothetical protein